ncbi:hypothetical protein KUF71_009245 [Frankliniella fusca]|uniref:Uncharacterized protein n=1 Tax=Frankliniella fusca TaxID=407009 RepID=A0AAE1HF46_9NEOP|nr:hypothetical protein KUF71_009245 [Frankliniella fusca]
MHPLAGGDKFIERLPIVVTGENWEQLLGARIIKDGTGQAQAEEVFSQVQAWGCTDSVWAVCTDTTSSNTGTTKGAVVRLEVLLQRKLVYFACRHHLLDLIPKNIFGKMIEPSSSPDLGALCRRFKSEWPDMDKTNFKAAVCVDDTNPLGLPSTDVEKKHIRADYEYLLELAIIFLGGTPPGGVKFRPPLALSSARFMGRIIY